MGSESRAAEERSEALLLLHLSEAQRGEYAAERTVTVVKEGVIGRTLAWYGGTAALIGALALVGRTVPHLEVAAIAAAMAFVVAIASFLIWIPPLAIACSRRRVWILGLGRRPTLIVRGRRIAFCVRVEGEVPDADRVLALKNVLEGDERYFLRRANALV